MYNISYVKSKSYSFIPAYERIARYQGLIKTAVGSQCSLTRTNFHFKPIAWFSARMDVAMCCWIVQLESSFEHFATSCNILQWSDGFEAWPNMAEQCFHFALLSCAQLLQKAREVTDPWDLQQGWTKIELLALFRLLSSCCLAYSAFGARQSASVSCLRLASADEHVRMSPSDLVLQVLRGSILGTKPSWHSLCRQICEAAGFIIDISWFHPSNMSNVLQNMLWVEWFTMC